MSGVAVGPACQTVRLASNPANKHAHNHAASAALWTTEVASQLHTLLCQAHPKPKTPHVAHLEPAGASSPVSMLSSCLGAAEKTFLLESRWINVSPAGWRMDE